MSTATPPPNVIASKVIGIVIALCAIPASLPMFGCDTGVFAANTTIGVMRRAAPGVQRMRDPDILEAAFPASIQQAEGLLNLKPQDPALGELLARSYASFGYGFLEDRMEVAELEGAEEEEIEHWRGRASAAYVRGREVAIAQLDFIRPEGGGLLAVQRQGLEAFTAHVARFDNRDEHAPLLFWTAYNWVRYISLHRDDMGAIADVAYVTVLADRVMELNPEYMEHAPLALRAGLMAAAPAQLGGRPQDAKVGLERAIELTGRRNLLYLVTEARMVAIPLQERELYRSLLQEAIDFDVDSHPDQRIPNLLAQRRARRYLSEIDNFFDPAGTEEEPTTEGEAPAEGAEAAPAE